MADGDKTVEMAQITASPATTTGTAADLQNRPVPEFSIVVKHPSGRGPIGPYRLTLSVALAALVVGPAIYSMLLGQAPDDMVFLRAAGIGLLVWITSGIVDSALAAADVDSDSDDV